MDLECNAEEMGRIGGALANGDLSTLSSLRDQFVDPHSGNSLEGLNSCVKTLKEMGMPEAGSSIKAHDPGFDSFKLIDPGKSG